MKILCVEYDSGAGHWIYEGYMAAWRSAGVKLAKAKEEIRMSEDYMIMCTEEMIDQAIVSTSETYVQKAMEHANKIFMFVQPNNFPQPWGRHPNFHNKIHPQRLAFFKSLENLHFWTFADVNLDFYKGFGPKPIHTIPLAFDSINYEPQVANEYKKFDISFVGGWADNGFNEKRGIILKTMMAFKDSGLKCGFFVNKNLSRQQEADLLANSRLTLNIHDAYQRELGLDTNERTFKSLGLNGALVSDSIGQQTRLFPNLETSSEPEEMVRIAKQYLELSEKELSDLKEENMQNILDNHCYTHRVKALLDL